MKIVSGKKNNAGLVLCKFITKNESTCKNIKLYVVYWKMEKNYFFGKILEMRI